MDGENGMDGGQSTVDDSDSVGNSKQSSSVTPPSGKEKKKPFFKKVNFGKFYNVSIFWSESPYHILQF